MKLLDEGCEALHQTLLEAAKQCESMHHDIDEFISLVSTLPLGMVKLRLTAMTYQIMMQALHLRKQHDDKGTVFIMMSGGVLSVRWAEQEYTAEGKNRLESRGLLIVSPEEIFMLTKQLGEKVDAGQLAEAVDWINRYEPSLTYNAKQFP